MWLSFATCLLEENIKTRFLPYFYIFFPGCEKKIQKVCLSSSEEHLEPFKEKMESFVSMGN